MVVVTLNQIKKRGRKRATLMDERSVKTLNSTFSPDFCTPIFVEGGAVKGETRRSAGGAYLVAF